MKAFVCMGCGRVFHLKGDEELCPKCEKAEQERLAQLDYDLYGEEE